jgi:hypothetical protein
MTTDTFARPDHNSLGKAGFIVGLIALVLSFVPFIGFASWLLAPLAVIFGLIAVRRAPRSLAIAGIITGVIALYICVAWIKGAQAVGTALNKDTFNTTGAATDLSNSPIIDAQIKQVWRDIEANKIAAGQKYGGHRLRFTNERIEDFGGDAATPSISFVGKSDNFMSELVSASFSASDGKAISTMKKGQKLTFVCEKIGETLMGGYSLTNCKVS